MSDVTPLHQAARDGDLDIVKVLHKSSQDLVARDGLGKTPLMVAVRYDRHEVAEFLVQEMTAIDLAVVDNIEWNVLHCITGYERPWSRVIRDIVDKCPVSLDHRDNMGRRPIDMARHQHNMYPRDERHRDVYNILEQLEQRQQQQLQQYKAGIANKVENPCNITITVVGHNGVGKSCFVGQLKQEHIPEVGPGSTDTADFYVNYLGYNPNTGFRKKLGEDSEIETGRQRLKRIIDRYRTEDNVDVQASASTHDLHNDTHNAALSTMAASASSPAKIAKMTDKVKDAKISPEQRSVIDEIMRTEVEDQSDEEVKDFITIYDFGGEKVFYNTHHCFMSSNMVFVLVFDVAMCLDPSRDKAGYERIEYWLRNIATYAIDKAADGKGTPPVILVGSHMDLVAHKKEEQEEMFLSVLEKLQKKPEIREIMETHVHEMVPIANVNDSTKNQDIYQRVWNRIIEVAPLQSQWKKPVPARWVALEHELVRLKNTGSVIITYADLLEINSKSAVPLDKDDIIDFLKNVRFSGSFLCFDLHSNRPFIVLQPQWIINAFKAIITAPKFAAKLPMKQRLEWKEYEKSGILSCDFIRQLWGRLEEHEFLENEDILNIVMETLGLLTKPLPGDDNDEVAYFIVPSMLQTSDPEIIRPLLDGPDIVTTATLCLKFDKPFIPHAVWDKMIAACIHMFQRLNKPGYDGLKFIQRGFACLSMDYLWNVIINCRENAMKITMFKKTKKDTDASVPTGTGINLLNILEFLLKRILELNHQSQLGYQFYLHNDFRFTVDELMVKVDDLRQTTCLECYGTNGHEWIDSDDIYIWFNNPSQKTQRTHTRQVDMTKNLPDKPLSFKEIGRVSRYIKGACMMFFVELGCMAETVDQEMEEHRHLAMRSRITKIFIQLLKAGEDIRFGTVADAMSRHKMDPTKLLTIIDCNRSTMFDGETLSETWLQTPLSVKDVPIIDDHVDIKAYFNLFLELGFSPKQVDEFDDQFKDTKKKIPAMLNTFIKETRPRPTVNTILLAMQECVMDTGSLIRYLKPTQTTPS